PTDGSFVRRPPPIVVALLALAGARALAWDVEVSSETIGQGYQLAAANGPLISRRRLDQYLGLHVWNLGPKDAGGVPLPNNQWYFSSSLRFEYDFGDYPREQLGAIDVSPE